MAQETPRAARDRAAARSKVEKARPPTVPVPQVDIVPGRLSEAEWIALLVLEEGEDVVGDILADLLACVMDSAFQVYLNQQAREAMLQIVQWRFLARDEGEYAMAEDPTWGEDEEPQACVTDTWAQGAVPVVQAPDFDSLEDLEIEEEEVEEDKDQDPGNPDRNLLGRLWLTRGSQERSPEQRATPGSLTTPELLQKARPGGTLPEPGVQATNQYLAGSLNRSSQLSGEAMCVQGPHSLLEPSQVASPQASADSGQTLDSLLFTDPSSCTPQLDAAAEGMPSMPWGLSCLSGDDLTVLSSSESVWSPELWDSDVPHSWAALKARLDAAGFSHHSVHSLTEIMVPDSKSQPLEAFQGRQRRGKTEASGRPQGPGLGDRVSLAAFLPLQSNIPFCAIDPDPALNVGPLRPSSRSKVPFPSRGTHFLSKHPTLAEVPQSPSPKSWPSANWPSGFEGEAELLGELWAGRTRVPPQGLELADKEDQHFGWPQMAPRILEASSQMLWKPMVQPEAMKLAPGVSMWNQSTQVRLRSAVPQEEPKEGGTPSSVDQHALQTGVPKPQMTGAELVKATPKAWLLPYKSVRDSES
ncbi:uncharacterized protein C2orf81 homolog isoform X2 [Octodon degus]|uniref:Uncharacterized protein C2orf81 homolog isoform X2 n=1 Tax=Octodon degus TaxID=10160 RepID=A0A6P6EQD8_OCTDE|nr:uncharacterized protein C2orf81 homolog isoform X2 [Octodon degus]